MNPVNEISCAITNISSTSSTTLFSGIRNVNENIKTNKVRKKDNWDLRRNLLDVNFKCDLVNRFAQEIYWKTDGTERVNKKFMFNVIIDEKRPLQVLTCLANKYDNKTNQ